MPLQEQYDKIYKYCCFKVKNAHLAEDLTQETFLRFFAGNKYISRGKPLAYLYTIARNLCIDEFRKKTHEPLTGEIEDTSSPLEAVELTAAVQAMLKNLQEDVQEILLLRYANDLSIGEIAAFTGLSRFAVRRKINGALSKLKSEISEEVFN